AMKPSLLIVGGLLLWSCAADPTTTIGDQPPQGQSAPDLSPTPPAQVCQPSGLTDYWDAWSASLTFYCFNQGTPVDGVSCQYRELARRSASCLGPTDDVADR